STRSTLRQLSAHQGHLMRFAQEAFARIKHAMRKAMGRSVEAVERAVAETLDTITPRECANYLANAGYKST
ncbi:MAG: IS630 family transposase, partial [Methylocella sp.]